MKVCAKRLIALFVVGFLLVPSLASAAGETYHYTNDSKDQIIGNGGVFSGDAVFRKSGNAYVPEGKITTNDPQCKEASLRIVTADSPTKIERTSGCTPAGLDTSISVVSAEEAQANCAGAFSWLVCEAIRIVAGWVDGIQRFVASFLVVEPLQNGGPLYQAWQSVRGLANVVFILVYLIAIFAQTLSIGVDAYTAKKVLPRLVLATVLVQFSYLISGLLVDISNVLGAGIGSLMLAAVGGGNVTVDPTEFVAILGLGAAAAGVASLVSSILSGAILITLLGGFFAVLAVFFTLVFRQVLISLLIMLAPLAFVAWVLPNTEQYFRLWSKNLVKTLMMYPMITVLFAAGKIVSLAASSTSAQGLGSSDLKGIIAFVAVVAPLIMIPFTFKFAGSALLAGAGALSALSGAGRQRMEGSSGYERLKQRVGMRQNELKQGLGVNAGFGKTIGANRLGKIAGRGIGPWKHFARGDQAAEARNLAAMNRDKNLMGRRFDEEDFPFEGNQILMNGEQWGRDEIAKKREQIDGINHNLPGVEAELRRAQSNNDQDEVRRWSDVKNQMENNAASFGMQVDKLEKGMVAAKPFMGNKAARMASLEFMADNAPGAVGDDARVQLAGGTDSKGRTVKGYAPRGSGGAELVGNQVWNKAKQKARKTHPHLAYTEYDGTLDVGGYESFVKGKNQADWAGFSDAAYKVLQKENILQRMVSDPVAGPQNVEMLRKLVEGPGPTAAPAAREVINSVIGRSAGGGNATPGPGPTAAPGPTGGPPTNPPAPTNGGPAAPSPVGPPAAPAPSAYSGSVPTGSPSGSVTSSSGSRYTYYENPGGTRVYSPASTATVDDSAEVSIVPGKSSGLARSGDVPVGPVSNPDAGYYYFDSGTGRWKPTTQTDALRREEMGEQVMKPRRR